MPNATGRAGGGARAEFLPPHAPAGMTVELLASGKRYPLQAHTPQTRAALQRAHGLPLDTADLAPLTHHASR